MKTTKKFTKKPLFESPFADKSEYCEKLSDKPVQTFIPHQAITLKELVTRFEHGQRLNVHQNFAPGSNFTNDSVYEEDFDDAPPTDVHDVVDVHNYMQEHEQHKKDYQQRQKEAKQAQQAKAQQAQQAPKDAPAPLAE